MNILAECLFCKIGSRAVPAEIVSEDDHTAAFLDAHPRAPGHTIVISKYHSQNLFDLPDEEVGFLFAAVKSVSAKVAQALRADGLTIGINQGWASGQAVDHLHVHIIPRFSSDRGGSIHSVVNNPPAEPVAAVAAKIRGNA